MNPVTHFLTGWAVANSAPLNRRERALVTLAGVAPDLDGLGLIAEVATRNTSRPLLWWSEYHHVLAHNLLFALACAALAFAIATRRWLTAGLVFLSVHLHLLGDLIGARGPDGDQWPIPYLAPFSTWPELAWDGQWPLNAWPNFLITGLLLVLMFYLAWKRGYSPLEMVSQKMDAAFVATIRKRMGVPANEQRQ